MDNVLEFLRNQSTAIATIILAFGVWLKPRRL
jgi:hypothetical protein